MNEIRFLQEHATFSTREFAFRCGFSRSTASRRLGKLAERDVLVRITRGAWCQPAHPAFTPNQAAPILLGRERGYISFITALHLHGVVSQIPAVIQVASTGHGRTTSTPIGRFEFLQIKPEMTVAGVETSETNPPYLLATAEKALLDSFYISTRRGKRFSNLPELDMTNIDTEKLWFLFAQQAYPKPIASAVKARLSSYCAKSCTSLSNSSSKGSKWPSRRAAPTALR